LQARISFAEMERESLPFSALVQFCWEGIITMRIAIFMVFISIQTVGNFPQTVWSEDLHVSLENEVAGITSGMTLLPHTTGNLDQPDTETGKSWNSHSIHVNSIALAKSRENLHADIYASAGFLSNNMVPVGKVLKISDNKLATTGPERLFIDIGRQQGLEIGDKFTVYSQERFIYHPVLPPSFDQKTRRFPFSRPRYSEIHSDKHKRRTGFESKEILAPLRKPMGYSIMIRGVLEVTEVGDNTSYANVLKAYEDIKPGEFLTPYQKVIEPLSAKSSNSFMEGYIVATKLDKIGVGITDIVYIDKGSEDGVHAGDVFEVYHIPEIEKKTWYQIGSIGLEKTHLLPDVLGELKIVKTEKRTATAVIVQNNYDMHVGNKIRSKR
jgi:hypothetical protein